MKASFLTFSQTGNTLQVARAIGDGLAGRGIEVTHTRFLKRRSWRPEEADLIGIGCPVFENLPAEVVPGFLAELGPRLAGKDAVVYVTSGGSPARSLWRLARAVEQTGARVLGGIQLRGCCTFPTLAGLFAGRPNAQDLDQARSFGDAVATTLLQGVPLDPGWRVDPRVGGRFYDVLGPMMSRGKKLLTPLPTWTASACDLCATCVKECPTDAVKIRQGTVQFNQACIRCYHCWHVCPTAAIEIQFSVGKGALERTLYCESMERVFGDLQPGEHQGPNLYRDVLSRRIRLRYDPDEPCATFVPASEIKPRGTPPTD